MSSDLLFDFRTGSSPLLVSIPHAGTWLPSEIEAALSPLARTLPDTDWFVDRLCDWVPATGAGLITAKFSRYVVDLNRPPDDEALYSSKVPGLVPVSTFSGSALYAGQGPSPAVISRRLAAYWQPYHRAIREDLDRIRRAHGFAVLLDLHSIRSRVPALFEGRLPDMNLGTFDGRSAPASLIREMVKVLGKSQFTHVVDGRFKGGYITRNYGRPDQNFYAVQLEMSQATYMLEDPPEFTPGPAGRVCAMLRELLHRMLDWRPG